MTDVKTLEEEVLLWALDGDTVNNLVISKVGLQVGCAEILSIVRKLADSDLLKVCIEAHAQEKNRNVFKDEITRSLLEKELYVTLNKTDYTLSRLRELRSIG